jgi:hypothetical protein
MIYAGVYGLLVDNAICIIVLYCTDLLTIGTFIRAGNMMHRGQRIGNVLARYNNAVAKRSFSQGTEPNLYIEYPSPGTAATRVLFSLFVKSL